MTETADTVIVKSPAEASGPPQTASAAIEALTQSPCGVTLFTLMTGGTACMQLHAVVGMEANR